MNLMSDPSRSPVQFFTYDHPLLARTLKGKLELERKKLIEQAVEFSADWPDYKQRLGMVMGLKTAIDICIEEEKKLGD